MSQLPLVSSHPTCSGPKQLNGSFKYELSEPHDSTCDTSWEDVHKTVIALNSEINETLVQSLTNQSITMKTCYHFLLYTRQCSGVQVMTNCSDPVNPTSDSLTVDWSVTSVTFGLCVLAVAIAVVVCLCICKPRCVRKKDTVSYAAPEETVEIELE
ncbi:unnamed protein product [Pleuronectes platessa]|uniref:Uncharacterized protein n=1 Tax=Pleuronectes platessa TaxID=8262 RepID=A0A9N7Z6H2_PLEPL|nr:unnamed protein product [Pleuronectes platessa]